MRKATSHPSGDDLHPMDLDVQRRRSLGIYYTPRSAAALLAKWAIRQNNETVLEPSFGACTILEAAVDRLCSLGCAHPANQIFGFDVDESAFGYLRRLLGEDRNCQFLLQDFLKIMPGDLSVTTVIANPPFVSYHRMTESQRGVVRSWRERYAPQFPMTASLWAYFLVHSLSFLKAGGRLAFVLPPAASSSNYAHPIIESLQGRFAKLTLYHVSEQLFIQAGANERTVVLLADGYGHGGREPCRRFERSVPSISELGQSLFEDEPQVPITATVHGGMLRIDPVDETLQKAMSRGALLRLCDVVHVAIGEVVGDTAYFVKSVDEWEALGIPMRYLRPLITRMRQLVGMKVTKQDVFTRYSAVPLLLTPPAFRMPKKIREYLDGYPQQLRSSNKTFAKRSPWYAVSYDATASAVIGSMAHESPKIVWNAAGISCANGLYKITVKNRTAWRSLLAAASLTTVFRFSAETNGRVRGSGALKLEPSDVAKLLIPARPPSLDPAAKRALLNRLDGLVRRGEIESAAREADDAFFLSTGLLCVSELATIRDRFQDLRGERLSSKRRTI